MIRQFRSESDYLLFLKEQACRKDVREAYFAAAIVFSAMWLSLGLVLLVDGWWQVPAIIGCVCIWSSVLAITLGIINATGSDL